MEIFRESNKYSCFYDLLKKRTLACLRIVIFDTCPVCNPIVTEVYCFARTKFCAGQILFKTNTTFTTNGSSFACAYEVLQKSQMTFDLQTILVQDQIFHLSNHAQEVTQLLALEYVHLTISLLGTKI